MQGHTDPSTHIETTCGLLLLELQTIWDEVGESDAERDRMLEEIEQECLKVYRSKVNEAKASRTELQRAIAEAESEIESICSALGEEGCFKSNARGNFNLKEALEAVVPRLEAMWERKEERKRMFAGVLDQLQSVSLAIYGRVDDADNFVLGTDLSMKKLEELRTRLLRLEEEKRSRSKQVLAHVSTLVSLCRVVGMDFNRTASKIHASLAETVEVKDITDGTIKRLVMEIESLREVKIQRKHRLQDLAIALLELWNLMDTPKEEQWLFQNVTCNIAASESDIMGPGMLSMDLIKAAEAEVLKLEQLKSGKMKELVFKRQLELEEICRNAHMVIKDLHAENYLMRAFESGAIDPSQVLEEVENEIVKVKEEASSRKEILDKVEKWLAAWEEECWLEEYSRNDNRYNAGRGTHLNLKRAEKARLLVNKIPVMVEVLISKTTAWQEARGVQFLYDGERLLSRLETYVKLRQEKEQEKLRQRDQKKLQVQLVAEQEALFGSRPSPLRSGKKAYRPSIDVATNRKLSMGGAALRTLKADKASTSVHLPETHDRSGHNCSSHHKLSGLASQSSGRMNSEITGSSMKKIPSAAKLQETEIRAIRKPLSPIPSSISSKANIPSFQEEYKSTLKTPVVAPTKSKFSENEENKTPKALQTSVPSTPATISAPMLMASTPATPYFSCGNRTVRKLVEQVEYSFEELRAGFVCPEIQTASLS